MCSCHSILECCVTFSGVKLSIRSFVLFGQIWKSLLLFLSHQFDAFFSYFYTFKHKNFHRSKAAHNRRVPDSTEGKMIYNHTAAVN